jgi:hypothetical protein
MNQTSPSAEEIRCGRADYDAARTKTTRGAVTTRLTEEATQPLQWTRAPGYIRHKTARGGRMRCVLPMRPCVLHRRMCTSPWQIFLRWRLQSPEGPLHQGSATPTCPEHQVFPRPAATVSQASWRDGNNFRGCASNQNLSREDAWTAVGTTTSRPPSSLDVSVGARGGSAVPARTSAGRELCS